MSAFGPKATHDIQDFKVADIFISDQCCWWSSVYNNLNTISTQRQDSQLPFRIQESYLIRLRK